MTRHKYPPIPDWMIPEQCDVRSMRVGTSRLYVVMNGVQASKPVLMYWDHWDTEQWDSTPFQTANFQHGLDRATVRTIERWTRSMSA